MVAAAEKARQTFKYFWRELSWERRRIIPGLEIAAVKATFEDPPEFRTDDPSELEKEHMWLMDVDYDGKYLSGTLINSPHSLKSVKEGDQVKVPGKQICDWMYVVFGKVYGGFTIDLMRSRMPAGERRAHDNAWGFDFGQVGVVNLVPPGYIGEEAPKQGFFSKLFGGAAKEEQQDYAKVANHEHPMSVNMRPSFEEALSGSPEMLNEPDDKGFTFLHQLALAGSFDGVDVCLINGADPKRPAENGMTPYMLAKSLGWKKVMKRLEETGGA
ncbi:hypothetical protein C5Y96_00595 [Blastopirellula marina]|uniref:DUF2314 domain-containing protein n=2 Tax=Pirellulales TaxID=2691354 RepID=A0A2S8GA40_9BACT|nr:hypothetical protein C5Y96_00595 [Blastopirellula marina]RCS56327.1 DUF2314 domain-containing protein [Bremerella cremea]